MSWGIFGPITIKTRGGHRVTFFAGFVTLPLLGWSVWNMLSHERPRSHGEVQGNKKIALPSGDKNLNDLE